MSFHTESTMIRTIPPETAPENKIHVFFFVYFAHIMSIVISWHGSQLENEEILVASQSNSLTVNVFLA